jgi:hypothetical protein
MTTQRQDILRHEGPDGRSVSRFGPLSTACWRGYVAKWEIVNDQLYLVGFHTKDKDGNPLAMRDVFKTDRRLAFW